MSTEDDIRLLVEASGVACDGPYASSDPDLNHETLLLWAADEIRRLHAQVVDLQRKRDIIQELRDMAYIVDNSQGVARVVMLNGDLLNDAADTIELHAFGAPVEREL